MSENLKQKRKGYPTPRRKSQEAARLNTLIPKDRNKANRLAKKLATQERLEIRKGIEDGNERYLPIRDKGEQKRFAREFVDSRFNVGEIMMPISILFTICATFFAKDSKISQTILLILWIFIITTAIDSLLLVKNIQNNIKQKFGFCEKGIGFYSISRAIQMRFFRLPKAGKKFN